MSNVRSLRNKMDLLHARCWFERAFNDICIIALSETWLEESVPDSEVRLDNFTIIRSDRTRHSGKKRGSGVSLYITTGGVTTSKCTAKCAHLTWSR